MQAQLGAARLAATLGAQLEGLVAANTELELALGAGEMHASPLGEGIAEVAAGAADAVLGQVGLHAGGLGVRVVFLLPPGNLLNLVFDLVFRSATQCFLTIFFLFFFCT